MLYINLSYNTSKHPDIDNYGKLKKISDSANEIISNRAIPQTLLNLNNHVSYLAEGLSKNYYFQLL